MNIAELARRSYTVGSLCGARGIKRAIVGNGCKRRSAISAEQSIDLPASNDPSQRSALQPRLIFSEGKLENGSSLEIVANVSAQVAVIHVVIGGNDHARDGICAKARHGARSRLAIAEAVGPGVAHVELITSGEAMFQARLQGIVLRGPKRTKKARSSGAAELAIQHLARGARADGRPVCLELVQLIRCPRSDVTS